MRKLLIIIILAIIYVAIGLYFWVRNLIIVQTKEKELPENEKYSTASKIFGSIILFVIWVLAWPVLLYRYRYKNEE